MRRQIVLITIMFLIVQYAIVLYHEDAHKTINSKFGCDSEVEIGWWGGVTRIIGDCNVTVEMASLHLQNEIQMTTNNTIILSLFTTTIILFVAIKGEEPE